MSKSRCLKTSCIRRHNYSVEKVAPALLSPLLLLPNLTGGDGYEIFRTDTSLNGSGANDIALSVAELNTLSVDDNTYVSVNNSLGDYNGIIINYILPANIEQATSITLDGRVVTTLPGQIVYFYIYNNTTGVYERITAITSQLGSPGTEYDEYSWNTGTPIANYSANPLRFVVLSSVASVPFSVCYMGATINY